MSIWHSEYYMKGTENLISRASRYREDPYEVLMYQNQNAISVTARLQFPFTRLASQAGQITAGTYIVINSSRSTADTSSIKKPLRSWLWNGQNTLGRNERHTHSIWRTSAEGFIHMVYGSRSFGIGSFGIWALIKADLSLVGCYILDIHLSIVNRFLFWASCHL